MNTDLALIMGLFLAALAVPSIASALSDRRSPRMSMILFLAAGALVLYALTQHPGGYSIDQVPGVFFRVIAEILP